MRKKKGHNVEHPPLHKITKKTKTLIHIIAIVLAFPFTWLEFHDLPIAPMFTDNFTNIFFKIILALYYLSWIIGTSKDLEDEEYVFLIAPNKGNLTISAILSILTIGILFACLCIFNTYRSFAIALTGFFIFNLIGWFYIKSFAKNAIEESMNKYKFHDDQLGFMKMKTIHDFLWGRWQTERFLLSSFFLVVVNIFAFSDLSQIIATKLNIPSSEFIIVLSIFIYVCVMELWIWYVRIKRNIIFKLIDVLKKEDLTNE